MALLRKPSPRRTRVRRDIPYASFWKIWRLAETDVIVSLLIWLLFLLVCFFILSVDLIRAALYVELIPAAAVVLLMSLAGAFYIHHYQGRILRNHARAVALAGLFIVLLAAAKSVSLVSGYTCAATAGAVTAAIILSISYDQRFAIGISIFYCLFASFGAAPMSTAVDTVAQYQLTGINLFMTTCAGAITCCLSLREIRTRMKLLKVSVVSALTVFLMAVSLDYLTEQARPVSVFSNAAQHAGAAFLVGLLIQSLLPVIEKTFRIATSMTLLDYSDANQPLLKRLALEAPGTFSHSLLIGSVAEAAANAIGRNGLLCRVGAYYHDIGKINKANYFIENEMGSASRHKELSPAMSQLIIVGHVKDGIEMAKEYGLPTVLRQFIEAHHGTTLIEHFYNEAKKLKSKEAKARPADMPSESEFRYPGPKPRTKEAAIVMLSDTVEGAVRSLPEVTPTKIEAVVHNMSMRRLQDGQFDECDLSLRELSQIEASISKTLAAHYHGRIAYPNPPDAPPGQARTDKPVQKKNS